MSGTLTRNVCAFFNHLTGLLTVRYHIGCWECSVSSSTFEDRRGKTEHRLSGCRVSCSNRSAAVLNQRRPPPQIRTIRNTSVSSVTLSNPARTVARFTQHPNSFLSKKGTTIYHHNKMDPVVPKETSHICWERRTRLQPLDQLCIPLTQQIIRESTYRQTQICYMSVLCVICLPIQWSR